MLLEHGDRLNVLERKSGISKASVQGGAVYEAVRARPVSIIGNASFALLHNLRSWPGAAKILMSHGHCGKVAHRTSHIPSVPY